MKLSLTAPHLLLALLLVGASSFAADGDDAMFGLKWGMTPAAVKALGATLTKIKGERNLETYKTGSLPKNLSDIESYVLVFADSKLVKLSAIGTNIVNDPAGSSGKERFELLNSALTDKYGKPSNNYQNIGNKLFNESDEFYQCLAYSGCGMWVSIYNSADKDISVELKGQRRGSGYVTLTAESKPQWSMALDVYKPEEYL